MFSISVTTLCGILVGGGCVTVPVPGFLLTYPNVYTDVGGGSSDMSSNLSGFNQGLKCILLMLR